MFNTARRALEMAEAAKDHSRETSARIEKHEAICTQRWDEARKTWVEVKEVVGKMSDQLQASRISTELRKDDNAKFWLRFFINITGAVVTALFFVLYEMLRSKGIL